MSTRLISGIAILEGLVLLGLSLTQLKRLSQDCRELEAAHQLSASLSNQFAKIALFRRSPDVLGDLEDSGGRQISWWIVCGASAVLFGGGVISLIGSCKCASRFHAAQPPAEANRPSRFSSSAFFKLGGSSSPRAALHLLLFGVCILAVWLRIALEQVSVAPGRSLAAKIPDVIGKLPPLPRTIAYHWYCRAAEGISFVKVPYNPAGGPWIIQEEAIVHFADSNGLAIVRFESAGSKDAYVCVRHKDASAMRKFVRSMGQGAKKAGSANGSQPSRSETAPTSEVAGSRR